MKFSFSFILFAISISIGCQSKPIDEFNGVKTGMDKSDVLETVGSPSTSYRRNGMDRWKYVIYEDGIKQEKEIHFKEGQAVYLGEQLKPKISAEEQDNINEKQNQEIAAKLENERKSSYQSYEDYYNQSKGLDSKQYVPKFEPVQ